MLFKVVVTACVAVVVVACGDESETGADNPCGFDSSALLPFEVGFHWTYRVTDLDTGVRATKRQRIEPHAPHADYGAVVLQITDKGDGRTDSLLRRDGGQVRRFEQRDFDAAGALERTTRYEPHRLRIDETMARNAPMTESFAAIVTKPDGTENRRAVMDRWELMSMDAACESPLGAFECVHVRRTRLAGGSAVKEFWFAPNVGKLVERGTSQLEELQQCGVAPEGAAP